MSNLNIDPNLWGIFAESLGETIKVYVKQGIEEFYDEKSLSTNLEDKRLNSDELCQRWNISKSTLYNWERDGIISPLPIGGRKKIYSMKDVLAAESEGLIKNVC